MSTIIFQKKEFKLLAWSERQLACTPQKLGFDSNNYHGFRWGSLFDYEIVNLKLCVKHFLYRFDFRPLECKRELPIINGVKPHYLLGNDYTNDVSEVAVSDMSVRERYKIGQKACAYVYLDIHQPLSYTGGLLVGRQRVKGPWFGRYDHASYSYEHLVELIFEHGILLRANDHATHAEAARRNALKSADMDEVLSQEGFDNWEEIPNEYWMTQWRGWTVHETLLRDHFTFSYIS